MLPTVQFQTTQTDEQLSNLIREVGKNDEIDKGDAVARGINDSYILHQTSRISCDWSCDAEYIHIQFDIDPDNLFRDERPANITSFRIDFTEQEWRAFRAFVDAYFEKSFEDR